MCSVALLKMEIGTDINKAASLLKEGLLVAIPTETVYGLGCDITNENALKALFVAKGRPADHPVIVHIGDKTQLFELAENIDEDTHKLIDAFWPGPLTLVFKKKASVSNLVTGGQDTVAIRMPEHPLTLALLQNIQRGVAAPSANIFGKVSPTEAKHVADDLGDKVAYILDGGTCNIGVESTILDMTGPIKQVLRPGKITVSMLESVLGQSVELSEKSNIRVPGSLSSHYSPTKPLSVMFSDKLEQGIQQIVQSGKGVACMSTKKPDAGECNWLEAPADSVTFTKDFYSNLRKLDSFDCDLIVIESLPEGQEWTAVKDRLMRAAQTCEISIGGKYETE